MGNWTHNFMTNSKPYWVVWLAYGLSYLMGNLKFPWWSICTVFCLIYIYWAVKFYAKSKDWSVNIFYWAGVPFIAVIILNSIFY